MAGESGRPGEPATSRITRVAFQQHDQSRVNIYIDGEFAVAVDAVEAVDRGWRAGRQLTGAELAELRQAGEHSKARMVVIDLLSRRPRSRRELTDRLRRRGIAEAVIERVLDDLTRRGFVDDAAFARYWVENRQANQPRGQRALAAELRAKGVEREVIDQAVTAGLGDETAAALALARRRARSLHEADPLRFRQRLGAFLQRKGYAYETVREVVRLVQDEQSAPAADESE